MTASPMIAVRRATLADAARLSDTIIAAFSAYPVPLTPPSSALKETAAVIRSKLADHGAAIAEVGTVIVGCVLFTPEDATALYLGRLAVHPSWRRLGVARALVAFVEHEARRLGLTSIRLSVRVALPDNQRLFASCGFLEVGREAHPGFAEPTMIRMEKRLA